MTSQDLQAVGKGREVGIDSDPSDIEITSLDPFCVLSSMNVLFLNHWCERVGRNIKTSSSFSAFWKFLQPKNGCQKALIFDRPGFGGLSRCGFVDMKKNMPCFAPTHFVEFKSSALSKVEDSGDWILKLSASIFTKFHATCWANFGKVMTNFPSLFCCCPSVKHTQPEVLLHRS